VSSAAGFLIVVLSVSSLHLGQEWRAEIQRFETGDLARDERNCARVQRSLATPARRLGRIVSCDTVEVASLPPFAEPAKPKRAKRKKTP
jgi:hypothetical protein